MVKFLKDPSGFSQLSALSKYRSMVPQRLNLKIIFLKPGEGFMFQLGKGEVIKGWDLVRN